MTIFFTTSFGLRRIPVPYVQFNPLQKNSLFLWLACLVSFLLILPVVSMAQPTLVKDINQTGANIFPQHLTPMNGIVYFAASTSEFGTELWRSDGTSQGTYLVKDITPGMASSNPEHLINVNGTLFFIANKVEKGYFGEEIPDNGFELWRSDGTIQGTVKLADIDLGYTDGQFDLLPIKLVAAGGKLFFTGNNSPYNYQLWQSDGTPEGTKPITGVGAPYNGTEYTFDLIGSDKYAYYLSEDGNAGTLWRTDGTTAGTLKLLRAITGPYDFVGTSLNLTDVNGTVFFSGHDQTYGNELWKTDGTVAGTKLVKDIAPDTESAFPVYLINVNGTLFFQASPNFTDFTYQLWKSDGTADGTVLVKTGIKNPSFPSFTQIGVNNVLYFPSFQTTTGNELWKSDGTSAGTALLKDINSGPGNAFSQNTVLAGMNGIVYFAADNGTNGTELWKSDGTEAGTALLKDINSGPESSQITNLTPVNGTLFFSANGQLWKSDGTEAGTSLITIENNSSSNQSSNPTNLTHVNGTIFFVISTGYMKQQLWKSNGMEAGTVLVKNLNGELGNLTHGNGVLYFTIRVYNESGFIHELWKSDGTPEGTTLIKTLTTNIDRIAFVNGLLYYTLQLYGTSTLDSEIWRSNGTEQGTLLLKKFSSNERINHLTAVNTTLYFTANDGTNGNELWKSDGTVSGTMLVKDINPGTGVSVIDNLVNLNGTLYFTFRYPSRGLWKSNGTAAGTVLVHDLGGADYRYEMVNANGTLYFTTYSDADGNGLWKSDGTTTGTALVKAFGYDDLPTYLTSVNGIVYFSHAGKLWKSNGTATGTIVVKEIPAYPVGSSGTTLLFQTQNNKLWRTDGTPATTNQVTDLETLSSYYGKTFAIAGNTLFFNANDGKKGFELWKYDTENCGILYPKEVPVQGSSVCIGDDGKISIAASESGVFYQAYFNESPVGASVQGNGSAITLTIPAVSLNVGSNSFKLKATACTLTNFTSTATINVTAICPTACSATGSILQEMWLNVPGSLVSDIPLNTAPTSIAQLTSFESKTNQGTNYGERIRGYLCVPQNGNYTFYIAGDDRCELWLSSDDDPAHKVKIASVPYYTAVREWNKYPAQKSVAITLQTGKKYYIEALHKEGPYADNLAVGWQASALDPITVIAGTYLSPYIPQGEGKIAREFWASVPGSLVTDIPLSSAPTFTDELTLFETPTNFANTYGQRIRGYLHPQQSGNYRFFIAGDDRCELWLSSEEDPTKKTKIASVPYYTGVREWNKYPSQQSALIYLVAGRKYYIEALHKEGPYSDNLAVGWSMPDQTSISVIAGTYLSPFLPAPSIARMGVEETTVNQLSLYPNPFESKITLNSSKQGKLYISIADNLGRIVHQSTTQAGSELQLAHLKQGVYVVKVSAEDGSTTIHKVIKR